MFKGMGIKRLWSNAQRGFLLWGVGIVTLGWVLLTHFEVKAQETPLNPPLVLAGVHNQDLPPLKAHPLPPTLAQWQDLEQRGDYFEQIQASPMGYLVWSQFPLKVYLDRPTTPDDSSAESQRFGQWVTQVETAIAQWDLYLPLVEVNQAETADIVIKRKDPPLGSSIDPETGTLRIARARTAQTHYEFYFTDDHLLRHRMIVQISPSLSPTSILSATRHELGHGLGIWGHSPLETDALYFSQVRTPPAISPRDINTLKKIYQQPTRLGWQISRMKE